MESQVVLNNIKLITKHNLQSENFREMLESKTGLNISIIDPDLVVNKQLAFTSPSMLIIDFSSCHQLDEFAECLKEADAVCTTVLLNVMKDMSVEEVVQWPALRGIFDSKDSIDHVCDGLLAISKGENWLPRGLINALISYYEDKVPKENDDVEINAELTRRELEILQSLKTGGSNIEIADSLFISEHTIKSHLYNIFKKIEVKNRMQATAWARKYLA
ncbi:LuxR C-terminal-related transcriptional regulator [Vibrio maerlii]|uniref:LuxR C-terminal-related transcriptional regulator n=1 Tax=Vibrio maerlii TaxID=2231648 RepID=UPI000E3C0310|nr:LuxR C-terminal-related transcriptional regulator [Vibrio maerlii]